jgi:histone-lysine N-methyltransferase SETMAR
MRKGVETDAVLLQQHNARHHTTADTTDAIARLGFTVISHPVYSPDLALTDFHLFPKQKEDLRSQNLSSNKEVKDAVSQWFQEKKKGFFTHEIQKHV